MDLKHRKQNCSICATRKFITYFSTPVIMWHWVHQSNWFSEVRDHTYKISIAPRLNLSLNPPQETWTSLHQFNTHSMHSLLYIYFSLSKLGILTSHSFMAFSSFSYTSHMASQFFLEVKILKLVWVLFVHLCIVIIIVMNDHLLTFLGKKKN